MSIEKILRWRLVPSVANRLQIPEPYCPTPTQLSHHFYPFCIDFWPFPSLRDQAILDQGRHNIQEIARDMYSHTVVEVPAYRMCLSVIDVFLTHARRIDPERDWGFSPESKLAWAPTPVSHQNFYNIIAREMSRVVTPDLIDTPGIERNQPRDPSATNRWSIPGLKDRRRWKISQDFAAKYSWLDCSSGMSWK